MGASCLGRGVQGILEQLDAGCVQGILEQGVLETALLLMTWLTWESALLLITSLGALLGNGSGLAASRRLIRCHTHRL